jgi:L-alanine-DL-glutamate epimerase-like enolase superfamily enzyme
VAVATRTDVAVETLSVSAYTVPTDEPESDGTLEWDSTTIVVVEVRGGGETGLGYTYGPAAIAALIDVELRPIVHGSNAITPLYSCVQLCKHLRNAGHPGIAMCAVSAVDIALWDLKARLQDVSLADLLPRAHEAVPVYGSGGFTSYSLERIRGQLGGWVAEGIPRVKMKLGREPERDPERLDAAREAIGDDAELFVDANGAFAPKQALRWAHRYAREWGVTWFEEPVSSGELDGLGFVREHAPVEVAAGEYAYVAADFRNLLGRVDCLQADVTRCGGFTGLLRAGALADAHGIALSGHCAPQLSAHGLCAVPRLRHLEYFHDHVRVERMLFDGILEPENGLLRPDRTIPGNGLELKQEDARAFLVGGGR